MRIAAQRVLIVEDDPDLLPMFERSVVQAGGEAVTAASAPQALREFRPGLFARIPKSCQKMQMSRIPMRLGNQAGEHGC